MVTSDLRCLDDKLLIKSFGGIIIKLVNSSELYISEHNTINLTSEFIINVKEDALGLYASIDNILMRIIMKIESYILILTITFDYNKRIQIQY